MFDKKENVTTATTIYNLMFLVAGNLWPAQRGHMIPSLVGATPVDAQAISICPEQGVLVYHCCIKKLLQTLTSRNVHLSCHSLAESCKVLDPLPSSQDCD